MPADESVDREIENRPWHATLFDPSAWWRRIVFLLAAVATGATALFFNLADRGSVQFRAFLLEGETLLGMQIDPITGTLIAMGLAIGGMWLVMTLRDRYFPGTQGTGIPQVMASLDVDADDPLRKRMLSWRIAFGKALLLHGEAIQLGRVLVHKLASDGCRQMAELLLQKLLRVGPDAVGMRKV